MKLDRRNFMGVSAAMLAASGARAAGVDADPIFNKEPLTFENVHLTQRSYK